MAGYIKSNPLIPDNAELVCTAFGIYPIKDKPNPAENPEIDCASLREKLNAA